MIKELTEYEKEMYKFAYECALKGIDIEQVFGAVWGFTKEYFQVITELTNKNYEFLTRCRDEGKKVDNEKRCVMREEG